MEEETAAEPVVARPQRCVYTSVSGLVRQAAATATGGGVLAPVRGDGMPWVEGETYTSRCVYDDADPGPVQFDSFVYQAPDALAPTPAPPSAEVLALQASQQVPLVVPRPQTAPPPGGELLVGLPTWLWIEPAAWQSFTATATVPGISVTVTATPRYVVWQMGNDEEITCTGPGTPWDPAGDDGQRTDCSYTYQWVSAHEPDGVYHASATITWAVTWTASTGETGTLADASRTATLDLAVTERQAVITYGTPDG